MRSSGPERAALCIFVKEPRPGQVKTRLAADLGSDEAAAALARAFLDDTLTAARARADLRLVVASVEASAGGFDSAQGRNEPRLTVDGQRAVPSDHPDFAVWPQGQGDLGLRLETVLRRALDRAPCAIAIGADTPGLPPALIDAALAALAESEAVIGPAADGGFYLLGLRCCPEGLLSDLPWSAADTCARTLERLRARWPRTAVLDPWFLGDWPCCDERRPHRGRLPSLGRRHGASLRSGVAACRRPASTRRAITGCSRRFPLRAQRDPALASQARADPGRGRAAERRRLSLPRR